MLPPNAPMPAGDPSMGMPHDDQGDAPPVNPLVTLPMEADALKKWKGDLDRARRRRKVFEAAWKKNLNAYTPDPSNVNWGDEVNPGVDFYQTEQKKGQLFFDTPEIVLTPEAGADPKGVLTQQLVINRALGRHDLNVIRLIDLVLTDIICPAGMGWTKLGVTRITKDVPLMNGADHPTAPGQPATDAQGQPVTAPVPVYNKRFWERISPMAGLVPTNFHSTEFDKAPWLGVDFNKPRRLVIREFQLPPDFDGKGKSEAITFEYAGVPKDDVSDDDMVSGQEVWYRAALYDDEVYHPDIIRQLVFIDGIDEPVVHRDSPYQTFQHGDFTPDSMIGYPIHIGTIRDLPDSSYTPSDCTITRPLVNELARFRTQLTENRDSSTSIRIADETVITDDVLSKVVRGPYGSIIRVANYDPARPPIMEVAHPVYSRENFTAQDKIEGDLAKVNAMSPNQVGAEQDTVRSATELTYIDRAKDVRINKERNRVIDFFLGGVRKLDALIKRYPDGVSQAQDLPAYSYDIKPDSGMHVDAAADRKFAMDAINFLAKEPFINRTELYKALLPMLRLDPSTLIVQPPEPPPVKPSLSVIIKGEDLSPLSPQYANILQIMQQEGVKITATPITPQLTDNAATTLAARAPVHGGTPPLAGKVNQHAADESGQMQGMGGLAGAP